VPKQPRSAPDDIANDKEKKRKGPNKLMPPEWVLQVPGVESWLNGKSSIGIVEATVNVENKVVDIAGRQSKCDLQLLGTYKPTVGIWYWGWIVDLADRSLVTGLKPLKDAITKIVEGIKNPRIAERTEFLLESGYSAVSADTVFAMASIGASYLGATGVLITTGQDGAQDVFLLMRELSVL
jgi:hypothetical protein